MNLNEYQQLAMITKKPWEDKKDQLVDACLGLSGESGEVNDIIKKHLAGAKQYDITELKKEIGDVMWYIAELCDSLGLTMEEVATLNIEKLKSRHGDKFSGYGNRTGDGK